MAELPPTNLWSKLSEMDEWRRQLSAELAQLPSTIADLRETITDLRKLTSRLEKATSGIEILIRHSESSGIAELTRRMDETATLVGEQSRLGTDLAGAAIDELQRTVASATEMLTRLATPRRT